MTRKEIKKNLMDLFETKFTNNECNINIIESNDLINDLKMDSIMFVSLVVSIEDKFEISIPDEMLFMEYFNDFDSIVDIISNELKTDAAIIPHTNNN